jgi:hypothetical protein
MLQQFDFKLAMHYIKGKENVVVNALLVVRQCRFHGEKYHD